jgi:hypothetical protein
MCPLASRTWKTLPGLPEAAMGQVTLKRDHIVGIEAGKKASTPCNECGFRKATTNNRGRRLALIPNFKSK